MKDQIQVRIAIPSVRNAHRESKNNNVNRQRDSAQDVAHKLLANTLGWPFWTFMSDALQLLIERFHAKRSEEGWKAKCPVHDDPDRSLSIPEGSDGRALIILPIEQQYLWSALPGFSAWR